MGSTLKEKNLLLEEQVLSIKSGPHLIGEAKMKMWKLLLLVVYPFISTLLHSEQPKLHSLAILSAVGLR